MKPDRQDDEQKQQGKQPDESGLPGGGVGRREEPGHTGVYRMSDAEGASGEAPLHGEMSWGQGKRGAEGYYDSGDSETSYVPVESEGAEPPKRLEPPKHPERPKKPENTETTGE